ncbi:hypothetical protein ES705_28123 [subsurface metagenome]
MEMKKILSDIFKQNRKFKLDSRHIKNEILGKELVKKIFNKGEKNEYQMFGKFFCIV